MRRRRAAPGAAGRAVRVGILAAALAAAALLAPEGHRAATAPPPPEVKGEEGDERPLDARLFAQGLEAVRRGLRDDAMRILKNLAKDFPDSPHAAPALLKASELIYPVSSWEQVGAASAAAIQEAATLLAAVSTRYRASPEAPRAILRLGYIALEPANSKAALDTACGHFGNAARVYPDSDVADDAWLASGMCETLRGRAAHAADCFGRLLAEVPGSPLADEARYRFGLALSHLPDAAEAMLALQRVRAEAPDSRFAGTALARLALLHRLRLAPTLAGAAAGGRGAGSDPAAAAVFRPDLAYGGPAGGRVARAENGGGATEPSFQGAADLALDAQGQILLASPKSMAVFRLDGRGRVRERIDHPDPAFVAAGAGLAVYISGHNQIAVNTRNWSGPALKAADGRPPRDFGPLAMDESGRLHLLDRRAGVVLVYDGGRRLVGTIRPDLKDGRFVDLAAGPDGGVFALEARARTVHELRQGKPVRTISLSSTDLVDPRSLAVDGLGDLFVLDVETGWVHVTDPDGRRITVIRPARDVQSRLGPAQAVAVDLSGRVYLGGRKPGGIVRYE